MVYNGTCTYQNRHNDDQNKSVIIIQIIIFSYIAYPFQLAISQTYNMSKLVDVCNL